MRAGRRGVGSVVPASLALGPIPEIGFVLQMMALGATFGAIVAARSFRRTEDADRRWLVATRWATAGFTLGVVLVLSHVTVGVP
jgi:hypothetical protein